jgi:DNA-binding XRE family transcriptional regulator
MITPTDCLAARGRLQWTREHLAKEAGVTVATVIDFELEYLAPEPRLIASISGALEAALMMPSSASWGRSAQLLQH